MIFIDFPDDSLRSDDPIWPVGDGPSFLSDIIDPDVSTRSHHKLNVSHYFRDMSFGKLNIVGDPVYKQAMHPLAWYRSHNIYKKNIPYWATRHILEHLDTTGIDFSRYDNWRYSGEYSLTPGPDGQVDMIFACYRLWYERQNAATSGFYSAGWANLGGNGEFTVEKESIAINTLSTPGSGVTVLNMLDYSTGFESLLHEFGHYLGLEHQYDGGVWSVMGQRSRSVSYFMNSLERERLGWVEIRDITTDGDTVSIPDFGSTGIAYRMAQPGTSQKYLIENHQGISPYDVVDASGDGAPGLYMLQYHDSGEQSLSVVTADGRWNWINCDSASAPWNALQHLPVFKRGTVDRHSGSTDRSSLCYTLPRGRSMNKQPASEFIFAWVDEKSESLTYGPGPFGIARHRGDGRDRWTADGNNIFSPWSNPASCPSVGVGTAPSTGLQVLGSDGNNVRVKFLVGSAIAAPPSRPQDLQVQVERYHDDGSIDIQIRWEANVEPDVNPAGHYEVWEITDDSEPLRYGRSMIGTVDGRATSYRYKYTRTTDGRGPEVLAFRIRAIDSQNLASTFSDEDTIRLGNPRGEIASTPFSSETVASVYAIPNPFSSRTEFHYKVEQPGMVLLSVYDLLGREVVSLVDEYRAGGIHTVHFDAADLAAGVYYYIYRQPAGSRTGTLAVQR